ncbi:hypothetical protein [Nonomuraea glycinis]|jgi:hypothetical protein|uniref:hypothetical protein n=1 Tax=Nonomuraea glycinis TaxID=2047744 RepID=UPI002E0D77FA|nr:hypothetical protein OHA68_42505 [Nonomuraea glycinis]
MTTYSRLTAFALLVGLVAACAPGGDENVAAGSNQPPAVPLTVEDLSSQVGCEPRMQVDASDLRTGYCKTDAGEFFVNTFTSEEGKNAWMDQAPEYKPHLVGPLWTVLGDLKVLKQLQAPLKGDLHLKDHRVTPTPAAAG